MKYILMSLAIGLALTPNAVVAQDPATETQAEPAQAEEERQRRGVRRLGDLVSEGGDEWELNIPSVDLPVQPVAPQPEVSLPNPQQDQRLQEILTRRAFTPDDPEVEASLQALLNDVQADAYAAMEGGNLGLAQQLVSVIAAFEPQRAVINDVRAEAARRTTLAQTLADAQQALDRGDLLTPAGQSANDLFQQVLTLEPNNPTALAGLEATQQQLFQLARITARELDFDGAEAVIVQAAAIRDNPAAVQQARAEVAQFRNDYIELLDSRVVGYIDGGDFDQADDALTQLVALGHDRARVERLRASLADARMYGSFQPGQVFADALSGLNRDAPQMVVIPAGSFMMGSPDGEPERFSNEGPRHRVSFERGFALARTEISVGDFAVFIDNTGYRTDAERAGSSRVYDPRSGRMDSRNRITWRNDYAGDRAGDDLPVIHVSWNDAAAYARWLAQMTGRGYRLPSEAEFEYALRAGSQTPFWWGDGSPREPVENLTGDGDVSPTSARWNVAFRRYSDGFWGPAPVGSLQPNPFGLFDMGGNVMEWVEDCWHDSFVRAPSDGSAWVNPGCDRRVIRGGSWSSTPAMSRSAFRLSSVNSSTDMRVGFRVARDL